MSELALAVIGFATLIALILLRIPVAMAMACVGLAGTALLAGWPAAVGTLTHLPFARASSYTLATIPLFILMGALAGRAGLSRTLFDAANVWMGHRRGGLAMATIAACAAFGAVCGSAIATAATIGGVALPEMRRRRYADGLATGSVAAGGSLGILIPPSVILVIYGMMTEQSIGMLLAAGVIPGLLLAILFIIMIGAVVRFRPQLAPIGPKTSWAGRCQTVTAVWEVLLLFGIVMGSLYSGVATPTESAAFGVIGMLAIGFGKRMLNWQRLRAALDETMRVTAMIYCIILGADLFGNFIALTQMSPALANGLAQLHVTRAVVLWSIIAIYIILGGLMDELAMVLLTVPVFFPLITGLGYDPIWFGIVIVIVVQIGMITPPIAMNVFVVGGLVRDVPIGRIYRGALPFIIAQIILLGCLTLWPGLALFLPRLMR